MRLSIEWKTLFVRVWDAVMKLTAVGKYYLELQKHQPPPPPPPPIFFIAYNF